MTESLDNLLVEAFSKTIFREEPEEGEIESDDGLKTKHKKSKSKSKHKSKTKTKTKTKTSKTKKSKSSDKSGKTEDKIEDKTEDESEVMKLLLSKQLRSYAQIEFKVTEEEAPKKSSKHKSKKRDNEKHSDKSGRHKKSRHSSDYEKQNDSYFATKCSSEHEDYFYGSYYEGMDSTSRYGSDRRRHSRPLSPLYDLEWKHRSRSRSPISEYSEGNRRRSLSPTERYYSRHRSSSPFYKDRYSRRSLSPNSKSRKRNISRHSVEPNDRIDKQKLLEIARINLIQMIEKGDLPKGTDINRLKLRHLRELTTQKSVQQWTEFCRAISALESAKDSDSDSDYDSDDDDIKSVASDQPFSIRHPFKLNERKDIQIKVRNFVQLPSRSSQELAVELRQQFPVSSGDQHRKKEMQWTEVEQMPPPALPAPKKAKKVEAKVTNPLAATSTASSPTTATNSNTTAIPSTSDINTSPTDCEPNPSATFVTTESAPKADSVFPQSAMAIDIGSVMAQRLNAMRKLNDDPHNVVALKQMYQANQMMSEWAESKIVPGQFIGSTGANVLSPDQLNGPVNAWTRKDQLKTAAPITEGVGRLLLLKMGWNPGQGLGKNNTGVTDPIMLDIKFDKKGLVAEQEEVRNLPSQLVATGGPKSLGKPGKNPVSILHELCAKKKWTAPEYAQVAEVGPDHRKNFTFKVILNGVEYQPSVSSANKKQARALAAGVCLQAFGLLPKDKT